VVSQANMLADLRGWSPFAGLQIRYSLADRAAERDLLPMARSLDLAVTPWSVLGAGILSGKYNESQKVEGRAARWDAIPEQHLAIAREVRAVAQEAGCTPSQAAIAWVLAQPGVIIPLLGARTAEQLQDNLGAREVALSAQQLARLDAASKIDIGFPHDFLASDEIRDIVYGGVYDLIDSHR
jgi:aryl-alcohol dehydrogenase-like predicted oxidoreductase